jgi:hypothetical protein
MDQSRAIINPFKFCVRMRITLLQIKKILTKPVGIDMWDFI